MGLAGRLSAGAFPLIRRLVSMACFSTARPMLEKNLQAVSTEAVRARGEAFVYERDAPLHLHWLVEESELAAKAGSGFGSIGLMALAECLGFSVKFRVRTAAAIDATGYGWWLYNPTATSPIFTGFTLYAYHTGGWHWKLGTLVSG